MLCISIFLLPLDFLWKLNTFIVTCAQDNEKRLIIYCSGKSERRLSLNYTIPVCFYLPELHLSSPHWLSLLARYFGHHEGHSAKGTRNRLSSRDVVGALSSRKTPGTTPITPEGPLTLLDGSDRFTFLASSLRGTGIAHGDRAGDLKADVE